MFLAITLLVLILHLLVIITFIPRVFYSVERANFVDATDHSKQADEPPNRFFGVLIEFLTTTVNVEQVEEHIENSPEETLSVAERRILRELQQQRQLFLTYGYFVRN